MQSAAAMWRSTQFTSSLVIMCCKDGDDDEDKREDLTGTVGERDGKAEEERTGIWRGLKRGGIR